MKRSAAMFIAAFAISGAAQAATNEITYERDGHEKTTFYVADQLELPAETALRLAFFSQAPDDLALKYSAPVVGAWGVAWPAYRQRIVNSLHSLHGGNNSEVLARRSRLAAMISMYDLRDSRIHWKVGFLVHALGDSYAHVHGVEGALESYSPIWGHIFDNGSNGEQPDEIAKHPDRYAQYVQNLCQSLAAAARKTQEGCTLEAGRRRAKDVIEWESDRAAHQANVRPWTPRELEAMQRAQAEVRFAEVDEFLERVKRVLDLPASESFTPSSKDL